MTQGTVGLWLSASRAHTSVLSPTVPRPGQGGHEEEIPAPRRWQCTQGGSPLVSPLQQEQ